LQDIIQNVSKRKQEHMQRLVKVTTDLNRSVPINGTSFVIQFKEGYGQVPSEYVHHFGDGYEILPKGAKIPEPVAKTQPIVKEEVPPKDASEDKLPL